ncbi:MAG: hypothetical protein M0R06_00215 [Sphaerochaeta sp.]|jgi:hypothetical protein|nr:hypothetical protein [Sphaerochaeta sp.]
MPFDANIILADDTADWNKANLDSYGTPTSTTKNAGGFAVIDLGSANIGGPVKGLSAVLVLTEAANANDDALTVIIEESDTEVFTVPHELAKFDILAATKGIILGSETPCTVVKIISPTLQYVRCVASCTAADDFGTCWCMLTSGVYKKL